MHIHYILYCLLLYILHTSLSEWPKKTTLKWTSPLFSKPKPCHLEEHQKALQLPKVCHSAQDLCLGQVWVSSAGGFSWGKVNTAQQKESLGAGLYALVEQKVQCFFLYMYILFMGQTSRGITVYFKNNIFIILYRHIYPLYWSPTPTQPQPNLDFGRAPAWLRSTSRSPRSPGHRSPRKRRAADGSSSRPGRRARSPKAAEFLGRGLLFGEGFGSGCFEGGEEKKGLTVDISFWSCSSWVFWRRKKNSLLFHSSVFFRVYFQSESGCEMEREINMNKNNKLLPLGGSVPEGGEVVFVLFFFVWCLMVFPDMCFMVC